MPYDISPLEQDIAQLLRHHQNTKSENAIEILETSKNVSVLRVNGRYIHSSINPLKEAERVINRVLSEHTIFDKEVAFLVFGFGLGYHIQALQEKIQNMQAIIIVITPCPELVTRVIAYLPKAYWKNLKIHRILSIEKISAIHTILQEANIEHIIPVTLHSLAGLFPTEFSQYHKAVIRSRNRVAINQNTLKRFAKLWVRNILRNISLFDMGRGIETLPQTAQGVPCVVFGGGPTLDSVIQQFHDIHNRALCIAVETALKPLQNNGIYPHIVITADPQYWNSRYLDRCTANAILIAESATCPRSFRIWRGKQFVSASIFPLGQFIDKRIGHSQRLGAGGSIATSAWDLARLLGAKQIILAGVDLAFPENRTHCAGSFFEELLVQQGCRLQPAEHTSFFHLHSGGTQYVPAAGDTTVLSDKRMEIYRAWFTEQAAAEQTIPTVMTSPLSSRIEGIPYREPRVLIQTLPRIQKKIRSIAASFLKIEPQSPADALSILTALHHELVQIRKYAQEGIKTYRTIMKKPSPSPADLQNFDTVDAKIASIESREVFGFLMAHTLRNITNTSPKNLQDALEQAYQLYTSLINACEYHEKIIQRYKYQSKNTRNMPILNIP